MYTVHSAHVHMYSSVDQPIQGTGPRELKAMKNYFRSKYETAFTLYKYWLQWYKVIFYLMFEISLGKK